MEPSAPQKAISRLRAVNEAANDLPRKGLVVVCVLLGVTLFGLIFRYIAPFVVALILASLMEPALRFLSNPAHKIRVPRMLSTALCMLLVITVLVLIVTAVSSRAFIELKSFLSKVPSMISDLVRQINTWVDQGYAWIDARTDLIDEKSVASVREYIAQIGKSLQDSAIPLANAVARGALTTAFSVPQIVLFIVLTVLSTFYMATDRTRIIAYFRRLFPDRTRDLFHTMKSGMIRALFGQLRAQVYLTCMMFTELLIGFSVMGIPYALLLALVIAIMDALPVVGSGLFLIPWSAFGFLSGNLYLGVGMILLYGITLVMRQLIEPRVVGAQLGVYPLATMMSMYAGFVLIGFLGMLLGPITFLLCRVAVYAICGTPKEVETALLSKQRKKRITFIRK